MIALQYHDVVNGSAFESSGFDGADADSYKLSVDAFRAHVAAVTNAVGRYPLDLESGVLPSVVFTFDDGGVSAATTTADVLEQFGWRGVFLMTTDYIGRARFLSEGQLRDLHARGHVIGAHSCSHPIRFSHCSPAVMLAEWRGSVTRLSEILGRSVDVGSVPGGYYSHAAARAAAEAGIRVLFTSEPVSAVARVQGCRVIGRFTLRTRSSAATAARLAAGYMGPRAAQWAVWNGKKVAKAVGGTGYLRLRQLLLERSHS